MAGVTFTIKGLKELDEVLANELPKATARAVLRRALTTAAEPMAAKARSLAPSDPNTIDLDSKLRENIIVATRAKGDSVDAGKAAFAAVLSSGGSRSQAGAALRSTVSALGGAKVVAYVGPTPRAFHGLFQEFGTYRHGPQAFLRPAFDSDSRSFIQRLGVEMSDEINKAAARARRKALKAL